MGREQRFSVSLKVFLVLIHHAVQPGQQLLGTVVRVEYHWNSVCRRNATDVVGSGNGTVDGRKLIGVGDTLWCAFSEQMRKRGEGRVTFPAK